VAVEPSKEGQGCNSDSVLRLTAWVHRHELVRLKKAVPDKARMACLGSRIVSAWMRLNKVIGMTGRRVFFLKGAD
jgi:hypothetical protein